ncbi:FMN-binding negative transcriptional regulator [Hymenobacter jeollabukensis]|uniref:FMN-binding negative transcriptional regulator n=1 Tax=Hymenobacter jeollabukensis TaxID=2025313 RepID=A0A5R8WJ57_9BACT|nr:FMN-binding negative transcriptional regulator [Hymenobacter jeollabukensis]TLM88927.1 FMN-binding negative transcriptional regulator [Hymenobacter jeollabukensis]
MYIPNSFRGPQDQAAVVAFMQRYSFATLVTAAAGPPTATHLPFTVRHSAAGEVVLTAHLARANAQWRELTAGPALVIFSEPHAYVSPRHYEQAQNVPTWNYIAVHAYGPVQLLEAEADKRRVLEDLIEATEPDYLPQWQGLPAGYQQRMLGAIVAFELTVKDLQAKYKLSQNRTAQEQQNLAAALAQSPDNLTRQLAGYLPAAH